MVVKSLREIVQKPITGEWGSEGDSIKVLRTTNFTNEGRLDYSNVVLRNIDPKKVESKKLNRGDIIIEKSGGSPKQPVGRVVFFDEEGIYLCNNFTAILRPNPEIVNSKYLLYILFCNHKFGFTSAYQNKTTGIINLQLPKYLEGTKIPLPPLPEQKKIAAILDEADSYRQKTKALLTKYDELTQSLFLDMFGDPVTNPKGWLKQKMKQFCEFENGDRSSNYPSGDEIKTEGKLFLSSGDIKNGRFIVKDSKFISSEKFNSLKRGKCKTGDVLMTLRGNGTGKTAVFNCQYEEGFINAQMVILRPDSTCLSEYLVLQLICPPVFKRLINLNSGSAQPQLSASNVKDFEVFVPPLTLQNQFAERVEAIKTQKAQAQAELVKAEELFGSLLQGAFKSKL